MYIITNIWMFIFLFINKIKCRLKNNKNNINKDHIGFTNALKSCNNKDIQSLYCNLEELASHSPYITITINKLLIESGKNIDAYKFIETNKWYMFLNVHNNIEGGGLFFILHLINKTNDDIPIGISNVIKEIIIEDTDVVYVNIYKDVD